MPHPRPWHKTSVFGEGRRRHLDRNQRYAVVYLLKMHRKAKRITPYQELVGHQLVSRVNRGTGQCDPSHRTIATGVGCSDRTVRRALDKLAEIGLLRWQRRLVRIGDRVAQTSNAYEITPETAVRGADGQNDRQSKTLINQSLSSSSLSEEERKMLTRVKRGPDLLAMRRQAILNQQMAALSARQLR